MKPPSTPPMRSPFEYPAFEALYLQGLRDVADRRLGERERKAAARAIAFLLRERVVDERVATDVLVAMHRALDLSNVATMLLLGLLDAIGDHEKIEEWRLRAAERARAEGHVPSFISAMRILVGLRDYDGSVRTSWQVALIQALEAPDLGVRRRLYLLADDYARRFGRKSRWVVKVWARYMASGTACLTTSVERPGPT